MTAPLPTARQQAWVSRVLGDDHYKRMSHVTVGVTRSRTLAAQWQWVPSIGQNLQLFTGNGDVSIWLKNYRVGRKTPKKKPKCHEKRNMRVERCVFPYSVIKRPPRAMVIYGNLFCCQTYFEMFEIDIQVFFKEIYFS